MSKIWPYVLGTLLFTGMTYYSTVVVVWKMARIACEAGG